MLLMVKRSGVDYFVAASDAPETLTTNPAMARYFYRDKDVDSYLDMVNRGRARFTLAPGESLSVVEAPPNDWY